VPLTPLRDRLKPYFDFDGRASLPKRERGGGLPLLAQAGYNHLQLQAVVPLRTGAGVGASHVANHETQVKSYAAADWRRE
jgi:hypothetical protein